MNEQSAPEDTWPPQVGDIWRYNILDEWGRKQYGSYVDWKIDRVEPYYGSSGGITDEDYAPLDIRDCPENCLSPNMGWWELIERQL